MQRQRIALYMLDIWKLGYELPLASANGSEYTYNIVRSTPAIQSETDVWNETKPVV
jgi:hypothetical protein